MPSSLRGKNHAPNRALELTLLAPVACRPLLPMRLPSKPLLDHGTSPARQFLLASSRAPRPWGAPKLGFIQFLKGRRGSKLKGHRQVIPVYVYSARGGKRRAVGVCPSVYSTQL